MNWRDLLYFSKGERRALTILLSLITMAWLTLILTNRPTGIMDTTSPPITNAHFVYADTSLCQPENLKRSNSIGKQLHLDKSSKITTDNPTFTRKKYTSRKFRYTQNKKYPIGTIIELNQADTASLKMIPGLGSSFAKRIVKYRNLLGGFYSVDQLSEVFGIDEDRFNALKPWFSVDPSVIHPLRVNKLRIDSLPYHPYLSYPQRRAILKLLKQKGRLEGWENLQLLEEFTKEDKERLAPYLSFE